MPPREKSREYGWCALLGVGPCCACCCCCCCACCCCDCACCSCWSAPLTTTVGVTSRTGLPTCCGTCSDSRSGRPDGNAPMPDLDVVDDADTGVGIDAAAADAPAGICGTRNGELGDCDGPGGGGVVCCSPLVEMLLRL